MSRLSLHLALVNEPRRRFRWAKLSPFAISTLLWIVIIWTIIVLTN